MHAQRTQIPAQRTSVDDVDTDTIDEAREAHRRRLARTAEYELRAEFRRVPRVRHHNRLLAGVR